MNLIKGKVDDHHRCASRRQNETKPKRFGITAATSIGWGQEECTGKDTAMSKEGVRVRSFMEAQKGKQKSCLKSYLAAIERLINRLTEVTENQYLTASEIKSFQQQTAGDNCPVYMTDPLNIRLGAAQIRFA